MAPAVPVTLDHFLRIWNVRAYGEPNDLMEDYVNLDSRIAFVKIPFSSYIKCSTSSNYSKVPAIDWSQPAFRAIEDPDKPGDIMLVSRPDHPDEGGINGFRVGFYATVAPAGQPNSIRCEMKTAPGGGWNGEED